MSEPFSPLRKGIVICVSGPSGVGKGTVISAVLNRKTAVAHSISITTRSPRPGEQEGVSYYFRSKAEFERMLDQGDILEYDCYCDHYYGTPRQPLLEKVSQGIDVLMDITVPGSLSVMQNYPEAITLFLLPPTFSELERRLRKRGTECEGIVQKRLQKAKEEINMTHFFQYVTVNDHLEQTVDRILAVIEAEHCRYNRQTGIETIVLSK